MNNFQSGLFVGKAGAADGVSTRASLDPRTRLLHIIVAAAAFFGTHSQLSLFVYLISVAIVMGLAGLLRQALVFVAVSLGVMLFMEFLPSDAPSGFGALATLLALISRFFPFIMLGIIIMKTVDVTDLIASLNKMKMPRVIVMPFAVTVRFIPTIFTEINIIRDSMAVRGIQLSFSGFLRRPLRTIEFVLVPLLFRSGKIAEELAASAMTRAIDHPCKKTSLHDLRFGARDYLYILYILATGAGVFIWR